MAIGDIQQDLIWRELHLLNVTVLATAAATSTLVMSVPISRNPKQYPTHRKDAGKGSVTKEVKGTRMPQEPECIFCPRI